MRLFKRDHSFTPEAQVLINRLNAVIADFIKETPNVDLHDVLAVVSGAGRMLVAKEALLRRIRETKEE